MKSFQSYLNIVFGSAIVTSLLATWLAPKFVSMMMTPPVSFGTNCEPAAAWSMDKVIFWQMVGLSAGFVFGLVIALFFASRRRRRLREAA